MVRGMLKKQLLILVVSLASLTGVEGSEAELLWGKLVENGTPTELGLRLMASGALPVEPKEYGATEEMIIEMRDALQEQFLYHNACSLLATEASSGA